MIRHKVLLKEQDVPRQLRSLIRKGEIVLGGNKSLKIYGSLSCSSGKRMKPVNRVFFGSEEEALQEGYRPCGHCLRKKYKAWEEHQLKLRQR
jgi:methylphosphotriester-DNA--protein-cysteine methyltransferase